MMAELLRRYSNRPDLLGPLVSALRRVNDPAQDGHETVTNIQGRTASSTYTHKILTPTQVNEIIEAYKSGATAKVLAERYDVHIQTIKKKLKKYGIRRQPT
ncbi:resolvase [Kibdelosporangium philippinense]|uniref:Resolvase n=1 Tax=Kibdelosporangium philippinense TaxID=211113 RepID=A0ABS8ZPK6_9PSEU|nr:resolvase [Kibdelosporangium philippinense]MCE7009542.1 resolvase [Kibdelosporangium philippinense]